MISNRSKAIQKQKKFTPLSASKLLDDPEEEEFIPKHLIEITKLPLRQREPIAKNGTTWLMQTSKQPVIEPKLEQGRKNLTGKFLFNGLNKNNEINSKSNNLMTSQIHQSPHRQNQSINTQKFESIAHAVEFRHCLGSNSNFDWRSVSAVGSIAFDSLTKRMFVAEPDEGKLTTFDIQVSLDQKMNRSHSQLEREKLYQIDPGSTLKFKEQLKPPSGFQIHEIQFQKFRERPQMRLGKFKTLLKGVEDTRIVQVLKIQDYVALELVQQNSQTYVLFLDRDSQEFKASFQYQREIKSGFIFLNDQSESDADDDEHSDSTQVDQTGATSDSKTVPLIGPVFEKKLKVISPLSGLLSIVQHGLQQYVSHLTISADKLKSFVFPLNRADYHNLTPAESLKIVDLHSRTMFGIIQDSQTFQVKQLELKNEHHSLVDVSTFDFFTQYKSRTAQIAPINCENNVLITLQTKRYLIYDYIQGQVMKEILALRGLTFNSVVCPRVLKFDLQNKPEILIYNQSIIRRVDILTHEIKKNIDLSRLKLPVQTAASQYPSSLVSKKLYAPQNGYNSTKTQQFNYLPSDLIIQAVYLMPKLRLTMAERQDLLKQQRKRMQRSELIYKQLGQITIALPRQMSNIIDPPFSSEESVPQEQSIQTAVPVQIVSESNYQPLQLNKEQRALFNAGMPISVLNKIPGQPQVIKATPRPLIKKESRPDSDVFNNGQRLVVVIGSEKRMIKII